MKPRCFALIGCFVAVPLFAGAAVESPLVNFSGSESAKTESFTVKGPWLLDWQVESEFPDLASSVINLTDALDRVVDTVADFAGERRGLKLFRDSGTYRIAVSVENAKWRVEITEISEEWAKRLEQMTRDGVSGSSRARAPQKQVVADSFSGWRAESDQSLVLIGTGPMDFRVSFGGGSCPGLSKAKELSFVTPGKQEHDVYDSILLDDGTRCYFDKVNWISR